MKPLKAFIQITWLPLSIAIIFGTLTWFLSPFRALWVGVITAMAVYWEQYRKENGWQKASMQIAYITAAVIFTNFYRKLFGWPGPLISILVIIPVAIWFKNRTK